MLNLPCALFASVALSCASYVLSSASPAKAFQFVETKAQSQLASVFAQPTKAADGSATNFFNVHAAAKSFDALKGSSEKETTPSLMALHPVSHADEPGFEFGSLLGMPEYVVLLQLAGAAHDVSEWVAYGENLITMLAPAPTREDLSQFGKVVDTYDLEYSQRFAEMKKAGVKGNDSITSRLYRPGPFTLSSKNSNRAKVDLDPEYTVLAKGDSASPYALTNSATEKLKGVPTVFDQTLRLDQKAEESEVFSPTISVLMTLVVVLGVRKGLEVFLTDK